MPAWGGTETARSPAHGLAQRWINRFGEGSQRFRFVKLFSQYLEDYTVDELEKIIDVLHDRHEHGQFNVSSPAIIPHIGSKILAGRFYEGRRLEIL